MRLSVHSVASQPGALAPAHPPHPAARVSAEPSSKPSAATPFAELLEAGPAAEQQPAARKPQPESRRNTASTHESRSGNAQATHGNDAASGGRETTQAAEDTSQERSGAAATTGEVEGGGDAQSASTSGTEREGEQAPPTDGAVDPASRPADLATPTFVATEAAASPTPAMTAAEAATIRGAAAPATPPPTDVPGESSAPPPAANGEAKPASAQARMPTEATATGKPDVAAPRLEGGGFGGGEHTGQDAGSKQPSLADNGNDAKGPETSGRPQHRPGDDVAAFRPADAAQAAKASDTSAVARSGAETPQPLGPATHPLSPTGTAGIAGTTSAASAAHAPAAPHAPVPLAGLAVEIASQALAGKHRFEIRLDPPELGRIDVRLDVDQDGRVTSRMVVERAETLDLLRRDAVQLERALQQAGLKTADHSLEFSLRQQDSGREQAADGRAASLARLEDDPAPIEALRQGYARLLGLGTGLDIRV